MVNALTETAAASNSFMICIIVRSLHYWENYNAGFKGASNVYALIA
jgi:hypothetical protein